MTSFDLSAYLDRIGLDPVPLTADGLRAVQSAQLRAIAFENFDPFLGTTPDLDAHAIFAKTVLGGRGGYCFELNALFGAALAELGFTMRRHMARVRRATPLGGPRSHLALTVTADDGQWLADCGFGGPGPLVPLRLGTEVEQQAPNGLYRLRPDTVTGETVVEKRGGEGWVALYGFDDAHVGDMDIEAANWLCANWPEMPFPDHLMLAGFDGDTRIGLFDRDLTLGTSDGDSRHRLDTCDELAELARGRLRLPILDTDLRRVWDRLQGR